MKYLTPMSPDTVISSEVIFLHEGRVEEQGPPQVIFKEQTSERFRQFLASNL